MANTSVMGMVAAVCALIVLVCASVWAIVLSIRFCFGLSLFLEEEDEEGEE